jgi:hypothetical protein
VKGFLGFEAAKRRNGEWARKEGDGVTEWARKEGMDEGGKKQG